MPIRIKKSISLWLVLVAFLLSSFSQAKDGWAFRCAVKVAALGVAFVSGIAVHDLGDGRRDMERVQNLSIPKKDDPNTVYLRGYESYTINPDGIFHSTGAYVPDSHGSIAIAGLQNHLVRIETHGGLSIYVPHHQAWVRLHDRPVTAIASLPNTLIAIEQGGKLLALHLNPGVQLSFAGPHGYGDGVRLKMLPVLSNIHAKSLKRIFPSNNFETAFIGVKTDSASYAILDDGTYLEVNGDIEHFVP